MFWKVMAIGMGVLLGSQAQARGVFGGGNSGDESIQLGFVKTAALNLVKLVTAEDIFRVTGSTRSKEIYAKCRDQIFMGLVRTKFQLVDSIPDGGRYHALARRKPGGVTEISRKKLEQVTQGGALTTPLLTAVAIHEAGHDCKVDGRALGDDSDPILNEIGETLVTAGNANATAHFLDMEFVEKVGRGEPVRYLDLSAQVRRRISEKYLDYVGDWVYLRFKNLFADRPVGASDFRATGETSLFVGWASFDWRNMGAGLELGQFVRETLQSGYDTHDLYYFDGEQNQPLGVGFQCQKAAASSDSPAAVRCQLAVSWATLKATSFGRATPELSFVLDLFGNVRFERVRIRE